MAQCEHRSAGKGEVMSHSLQIYCDGSVQPNPGTGGWAYAAYDQHGREIHCGSGALPHATNNTAEMAAALHAMLWAGQRPACILSDSQYVVNGLNTWMYGWHKNDWMRREKGVELVEIPNAAVWRLLMNARQKQHQIRWVKGHAGILGNERVDKLAGAARMNYTRLHGEKAE